MNDEESSPFVVEDKTTLLSSEDEEVIAIENEQSHKRKTSSDGEVASKRLRDDENKNMNESDPDSLNSVSEVTVDDSVSEVIDTLTLFVFHLTDQYHFYSHVYSSIRQESANVGCTDELVGSLHVTTLSTTPKWINRVQRLSYAAPVNFS